MCGKERKRERKREHIGHLAMLVVVGEPILGPAVVRVGQDASDEPAQTSAHVRLLGRPKVNKFAGRVMVRYWR